jgi:hypothetical protein
MIGVPGKSSIFARNLEAPCAPSIACHLVEPEIRLRGPEIQAETGPDKALNGTKPGAT